MEDIIHKAIKEYTQHCYNSACLRFGSTRILGTFSFGLANYGFLENDTELRAVTVYLPSFEDLCFTMPKSDFTKDHVILDIRNLYHINDTTILALELLFAEVSIINDKYKGLFEELMVLNREKFARINPRKKLLHVYDRMLEAKKNEDDFEACRLYMAACLYAQNKPCKECFKLEDPIYRETLLELKRGNGEFDFHAALHRVGALAESIRLYSIDADNDFKNGIVKLVESGLKETVDTDNFTKSLTPKEKVAFDIVKKEIPDGEGTFAISKMLKKYEGQVSRTAYNKLFAKMTEQGVAEINNQGVKGIHIRFY